MLVAGITGLVFIALGTLAGNTQIGMDKVIIAIGYSILGGLCIMMLAPRFYLLAFAAMILISFGVEVVQSRLVASYPLRINPVMVHTAGFMCGSCVGFVLRFLWLHFEKDFMMWVQSDRYVTLQDQEVLFYQGEESKDAYVLKSGQIEVLRTNGTETKVLGKIEPGEVVGEMGAVESLPRLGMAKAVGPAVVYRISAEEILGGAKEDEEEPLLIIARVLAQRLRKANRVNASK